MESCFIHSIFIYFNTKGTYSKEIFKEKKEVENANNEVDSISENELEPHIKMEQVPGIPLIYGFKMPYGSWHLLNEALWCYIHCEHYACIACMAGCVEIWLKHELGDQKKNFSILIAIAKKNMLISSKDAEVFTELRKIRNAYFHFDRKNLPIAITAKTVRINEGMAKEEISDLLRKKGEIIDPYSAEHMKDAFPLIALPFVSFLWLNSLIDFFKKRYPQSIDSIASYYKVVLLEIEGLKHDQINFNMGYLRKKQGRMYQIWRKIDKLFGL